ncbi:MAG: RluA family pseudouridine synthase, partial [Planctomycetia bacterium]|nr:RluA family pseudouridine synthase [Planctomycetia bacterium]
VHLSHYGCPVLCDKLYGGRSSITLGEIAGKSGIVPESDDPKQQDEYARVLLARQALHARRLIFEHPHSGETIEVEAPLPSDMQTTLDAIRQYRSLS